MLDKYKAVIFDLDGTLVDSMWVWKNVDIDFLEKRNYSMPDDLEKSIEGFSFTETAVYFKERFRLPDSIEEIKDEWVSMAEEFYSSKIKLKEGVLDLLNILKSKDIKMGIATSNSRELAEMTLKNNNILDYFEILVTSCDVPKGKPFPDVYLKVSDYFNLNPMDCLVFEDTHAGVIGAKRAGMDVFAVYDYYSKDFKDEITLDADKYLTTIKEIL